ncbi:MAG: signal peptidase II [Mycobacteriales bacterium]
MSPAEAEGLGQLRKLWRRRTRQLAAVAVTVVVCDALSKALVVKYLSHHAPIRLLGGLLHLTLTRNAGAAFSIGTGATVVFTVVAAAVVVVIVRTARRLTSLGWAVSLGLVLGGALGNLGDRLFRSPGPLRGHVVDWIQLPHWPVFNLADASIVVGALLAAILGMRGVPLGSSGKPK